jgi:hypothetical protein
MEVSKEDAWKDFFRTSYHLPAAGLFSNTSYLIFIYSLIALLIIKNPQDTK